MVILLLLITNHYNDLDDVIDGTSIVKFASALKGEKLYLYSNAEGGNIEITSPDGTVWNIDAFDNNLRIFTGNAANSFIFRKNGDLQTNGEIVGKITNSYNSDYATSAKKSDSTSTVDGTNVKLYSDSEGGNLELISPNGTGWNIDAFDGNLRIFTGDASNSFIFRKNGDLQINGEIFDTHGNSFSKIGENVHVNLVEIGNSHTSVLASISLVKLSKSRANLYINYQIISNDNSPTVYSFISSSKICSALGINTISDINPGSCQVILSEIFQLTNNTLNMYGANTSANDFGKTGLCVTGSDELGIGRVFNDSGDVGSWALSNSIYAVGNYGRLILNGISYT